MGGNSKLIREARNLAAARGHKLGEFRLTSISGANRENPRPCLAALCDDCGALLGIDPTAPPGVSEIWGEALEIDCQDKQAGKFLPKQFVNQWGSLLPGQTVIVTHKWGGPPSIATVVRESGPGVYQLKDAAGNHFYVGAAHIRPRNED